MAALPRRVLVAAASLAGLALGAMPVAPNREALDVILAHLPAPPQAPNSGRGSRGPPPQRLRISGAEGEAALVNGEYSLLEEREQGRPKWEHEGVSGLQLFYSWSDAWLVATKGFTQVTYALNLADVDDPTEANDRWYQYDPKAGDGISYSKTMALKLEEVPATPDAQSAQPGAASEPEAAPFEELLHDVVARTARMQAKARRPRREGGPHGCAAAVSDEAPVRINISGVEGPSEGANGLYRLMEETDAAGRPKWENEAVPGLQIFYASPAWIVASTADNALWLINTEDTTYPTDACEEWWALDGTDNTSFTSSPDIKVERLEQASAADPVPNGAAVVQKVQVPRADLEAGRSYGVLLRRASTAGASALGLLLVAMLAAVAATRRVQAQATARQRHSHLLAEADSELAQD